MNAHYVQFRIVAAGTPESQLTFLAGLATANCLMIPGPQCTVACVAEQAQHSKEPRFRRLLIARVADGLCDRQWGALEDF